MGHHLVSKVMPFTTRFRFAHSIHFLSQLDSAVPRLDDLIVAVQIWFQTCLRADVRTKTWVFFGWNMVQSIETIESCWIFFSDIYGLWMCSFMVELGLGLGPKRPWSSYGIIDTHVLCIWYIIYTVNTYVCIYIYIHIHILILFINIYIYMYTY